MSKRRSIKHPQMDMVNLRPWVEDKDIPTIQEHLIPDDFGE